MQAALPTPVVPLGTPPPSRYPPHHLAFSFKSSCSSPVCSLGSGGVAAAAGASAISSSAGAGLMAGRARLGVAERGQLGFASVKQDLCVGD